MKDPLDTAKEHIRETIADVVLADLDNDGDLAKIGATHHRTVDVLYRLSWACSAIESAERGERALRSA